MKRITILMIVITIFSSLTSCSNKDEMNQHEKLLPTENNKVVGLARIEPEKGLLTIYSSANGRIETITAEENEILKAGSPLIILDRTTEEAELKQEESKIATQIAAITSAEANANAVLSDLKKANADIELNEKLFAAKVISEQTLKDSQSKQEKIKYDYQKQLAELSIAKNRLAEIHSVINYKKSLIAGKTIRVPYNGKILQVEAYKGDYVTIGQKLGQFAPKGQLVAVTEVDELFAEKVKTGMKADIISQLDGKKICTGNVVFVADFLKKKSLFSDENATEDRRVKEARILLDSASNVVINSKVDCIIYTK